MIPELIGALVGAFIAYTVFVERKNLKFTGLVLEYDDLPESFDGFTILQLSDMHESHWWELERKMEKVVKAIGPVDALALTGDVAVNSRGARLVREFLERVRPNDVTHVVYGNSEHKGEFGRERREDLNWPNLKVLVNEHEVIRRGTETLVLAGVDDPFTKHDDLDKALEGAPSDAFKVLLAHTPEVAGQAADKGVHLLLAGHTHGGQIVIPLLGVIYPHIHRHRSLVSGLFQGPLLSAGIRKDAGNLKVYVSRGIGISNLPMRFMCPPEIVLVKLKKKRTR